jgi:hypothetical protein
MGMGGCAPTFSGFISFSGIKKNDDDFSMLQILMRLKKSQLYSVLPKKQSMIEKVNK